MLLGFAEVPTAFETGQNKDTVDRAARKPGAIHTYLQLHIKISSIKEVSLCTITVLQSLCSVCAVRGHSGVPD